MKPTSVDDSFRLLAATYLDEQARQLSNQLDGARVADDIEWIHRARVASRRLRSALRIFEDCFRKKKVKQWSREIRLITKGLGRARDKDVQIEHLSGVLFDLSEKDAYPGVARLLVQLEHHREAYQAEVVDAIDRLEEKNALDDMRSEANKVLRDRSIQKLGVQSYYSFDRSEGKILDRLDDFMLFEDCLKDPSDVLRHHQMRIAAKQLRYTIEICNPVYEGRLDEGLGSVKKIQSFLGEIHDCDVWLEQLETFSKRLLKRTLKYFPNSKPFARLEIGISYLREDRKQRRRQVFGKLTDFWRDLDQKSYWRKLAKAVRNRKGHLHSVKSDED